MMSVVEPNAENVVSPSLGACRIYIDVEIAGHIGKKNCWILNPGKSVRLCGANQISTLLLASRSGHKIFNNSREWKIGVRKQPGTHMDWSI
jgi:hypothetical protein